MLFVCKLFALCVWFITVTLWLCLFQVFLYFVLVSRATALSPVFCLCVLPLLLLFVCAESPRSHVTLLACCPVLQYVWLCSGVISVLYFCMSVYVMSVYVATCPQNLRLSVFELMCVYPACGAVAVRVSVAVCVSVSFCVSTAPPYQCVCCTLLLLCCLC